MWLWFLATISNLEAGWNHFIIKTEIFIFYLTVIDTSDFEQWNSFYVLDIDLITESDMQFVNTPITTKAWTACVERIFSMFSAVHSKLDKILGIDETSKLMYVMMQLNNHCV